MPKTVVRCPRVIGDRRAVTLMLALAVLLVVPACASSRDGEAGAAAERFLSAVADGDAETACGLLLPDTAEAMSGAGGLAGDCAEVLPELELRPGAVRETQVWGMPLRSVPTRRRCSCGRARTAGWSRPPAASPPARSTSAS
ncbi:MAG TPA: hypothetical protein VGD67_05440 [Pseudonocardiaceae bacterium]